MRRVYEGIVADTLVEHMPGWDTLALHGYGWREYAASLCDVAQVLASAALFWPTVVEEDGCLLWDSGARPSQMEQLRTMYGPNKTNIERKFNIHRIVDLFFPQTSESIQLLNDTQLVEALGLALKRFWEMRLQTLFPERTYVVELGDNIGEDALAITFYQQRANDDGDDSRKR